MKKTYVLSVSTVILVASLVACQKSGNGTPAFPRPGGLPGGGPFGNPYGYNNGYGNMGNVGMNGNNKATNGNISDEVIFRPDKNTQTTYNPNDYTHVVNPSVKPTFTGYSVMDGLEFTDAGNDAIMEKLKARLANRKESSNLSNELDPAAKNIDANFREQDQAFAKSITMAELRRTGDDGELEMHFWIADKGEIIFNSPADFIEEGTRKTNNMTMKAADATSEAYNVKASCVTRVSKLDDADSRKRACQTVVAELKSNGNVGYVVFRTTPAKVFLGEYTSRLLSQRQNDPIIDRWVEFFHDVVTYPHFNTGSLSDSQTIADIRSFSVVNGIAAFTLSINRGQYGKIVVSGDLAASQKNISQKINLPLERGVSSGTEEQVIDTISETITGATLVQANGRGMLHILMQIGNSNDATDPDSGGVIFNQRALAQGGIGQASLFQRNLMARFSFATRNKSSRLQDKSNRAIRFTVVPVLSSVVEPSF